MAVAALKQKALLKICRTAVHVTEPWCIEAESAEEARKLRSAGVGYRCAIGDCVNIEVERVLRVHFAILTSSMKTWISGGRSGSYGTRK